MRVIPKGYESISWGMNLSVLTVQNLPLPFLQICQKLREDALAIRNKRKLEEILEQNPHIHKNYIFENLNGKAKERSNLAVLSFLQSVSISLKINSRP